MSTSLHGCFYPQFSNVGNVLRYSASLTKLAHIDLSLQCSAVCTISSVPSVPWGSHAMTMSLQMTRQSAETVACSRLLWLLLQCTLWSMLQCTRSMLQCTRGRPLSPGPGPVLLYPATPCHMLAQDVSRVQKLKISFGVFFNYVCASWILGTDYVLVGQKIAGSRFQPENLFFNQGTVQCPWTLTCKGGVLLKCKIPQILFLQVAAMQSTQPSESNQLNWWSTNVCSVGTSRSCRGHTVAGAGGRVCTCRPWTGCASVNQTGRKLLLIHIPLQYVNFICC